MDAHSISFFFLPSQTARPRAGNALDGGIKTEVLEVWTLKEDFPSTIFLYFFFSLTFRENLQFNISLAIAFII